MRLMEQYLLTVQGSKAMVFPRNGERLQSSGGSKEFQRRATAAAVCEFAGERWLLALEAGGKWSCRLATAFVFVLRLLNIGSIRGYNISLKRSLASTCKYQLPCWPSIPASRPCAGHLDILSLPALHPATWKNYEQLLYSNTIVLYANNILLYIQRVPGP